MVIWSHGTTTIEVTCCNTKHCFDKKNLFGVATANFIILQSH